MVGERVIGREMPFGQPPTRTGGMYIGDSTTARLGQGGFRVAVTEAYERRCAVTGERTLPVLQAAHIKPVNETGPHSLQNGLLLRADLHILLDKGYLTVTDKMKVEVSPRIKSDFDNGKQYYALHGQKLQVLPEDKRLRPGIDYLRWHNEFKFRQ